MQFSLLRQIALATSCALAGCTVGPDYVAPPLEAPDAWHREVVADLDGQRLEAWWSLLGDPHLEDLIVRAGSGNLDLRQAFERVNEAMAQRGVAASNRWPQTEGLGGASTNAASERVQPQLQGNQFNAYQLGVSGSWEIDAFGRITRLIESAEAGLAAQLEAYRDVMVVLYAEVGIQYIELRTLRERLRLTEENIRLQETTLQLTRDRSAAGLVSDLDVRQAELNLARTRSVAPSLRAAIAATSFRIAVLCGDRPSEVGLGPALSAEGPLSLPERTVLTSPLDALRRRPDLRAAERRLAAEIASIGVAEADLYPRFALLGSMTFEGIDGNLGDTFAGDSLSSSFGPSFRWNLLNGERVHSQIDAQIARADQARTGYEQAVLRALEDVEASLAAYAEETLRLEQLEASVRAAQQSVELVETLYRTGSVDFQNVLDTQRALATQQDEAAVSRGLILKNLIRLFRALGGGWAESHSLGTSDQAPLAQAI
jgi:NodT family efflux transporter outer membrane factor (OMF) lipoprotein